MRPWRTPDTQGPTARQSLNDCFAYALVVSAQRENVSTPSAQEIIQTANKPYGQLRTTEYKHKAIQARGHDIVRYRSSIQLLYHLHRGRTVLVSYLLEPQGIAHQVVAYSFDKQGIRVSDPLTGTQEHLPWYHIVREEDPAFMQHPIGVRISTTVTK